MVNLAGRTAKRETWQRRQQQKAEVANVRAYLKTCRAKATSRTVAAISAALIALVILLLASGSAGARGGASGSGKPERFRLAVTPSIVLAGRTVTARLVGSRGRCTVELIRSRHLIRVWKTKPHRTKLALRSGRKSGALTI